MQALALKYRPKSFDDLIGQDAIKENLVGALMSGRLGHAYLFSGLRGSGKTSSARIFAKDLLCEKGISAHPCETCENCVAANEGRHIDIIELDAASHRKIEDIRDLNEQTKYSPVTGRFKIFIIDEAHMLTKEASNAFLKTLEEPPAHVKFILATTDPLKLPVTILSRTQHFRFKAISQDLIIDHLKGILSKEQVSFEESALKIIARSGSGSMRDTLTLLDQAIIYCGGNITAAAITDMLGILDPAKIDEILNVVTKGDHLELYALIKSLESRDAEMIITELIESLKEKFISPIQPFSLLIFERFFKILSEAKNMLSSSGDPEFTLYITLFSMSECFALKPNLNVGIPNNNFGIPKAVPSGIPNNQAGIPSGIPNAVSNGIPSGIPNNQTQIPNAQNTPKQAPQMPTNAGSSQIDENQLYNNFVEMIYDRSYDLGEIFKSFIKFAGFRDGKIHLISSAISSDAQLLRDSTKLLRELGEKCFGSSKFDVQKQEQPSVDELMDNILKDVNLAEETQNNTINNQQNNTQNFAHAQNSQVEQSTQYSPNNEVGIPNNVSGIPSGIPNNASGIPTSKNEQNTAQKPHFDDIHKGELDSLFGEPEIQNLEQ